MHCIQCGPKIEYDVCPSCKESPISLYNISRKQNIWNFCWNCGNHLEDNEERCINCDYKREQITDELEYIACPDCNNNIDPVFDCPYCVYKIYPKFLEFQPGSNWSQSNRFDCPFPLEPNSSKLNKNTGIVYARDKKNKYTKWTKPKVFLHYSTRNNTQNKTCIAQKIKEYFGLKRLRSERIKKLQKCMPRTISLELKNKKLHFKKNEIDSWFKLYKKIK